MTLTPLPPDVQTVYHLIQSDAEGRDTALTIAGNLVEDGDPGDDIAVVAQAEGIEPLKRGGEGSDDVRSLIEDGVAVKACGNTLDMFDLSEDDLIEGVEKVGSGARELTRLQDEGYAYQRP